MQELDLTTIKKRSVGGVFALTSRTFLVNIISYAASLIIFTALSPREVGIYTAVIAMQRIISFFTDFGLGAALVQKKDNPSDVDLSTVFTVQALATGCMFLFIFLLKDSIGTFFKLNLEGTTLLAVLVFTIFISSFKTIPSILLERNLNFHKLVIPQIVESLVFNIILVFLLFGHAGLASFSWAFLLSSLVGIPFYYLVSPWKIRFGVNKKSLSNLRFGITFQAKNILATIKDDFLTVFLTKFLSFSDIGYIGFAQRNAFFAFRYVVDNVTKVSFSTYSRVQHDSKLLKSGIEKSLFFVSFTMSPLMLGLIVIMPYIVEFFPKWHNKWEPAIFSVIFFSLNALVSSFSNILINVLDATGRVKLTLKLMIVWTTLIWIITPFLLYKIGYNGVAIASFLVTLTIFYTVYLVKKVIPFNFFGSVYKPIVASCIMATCIYLAEMWFARNLPLVLVIILFGAVIYTISIYILAKQQLREGIKLIVNKKT